MSGLEHGTRQAEINQHLKSILPDREKIYFLRNYNGRIKKIIIDIKAVVEIGDMSRLEGESDLAEYLKDEGISPKSFTRKEALITFLELEKKKLKHCFLKNKSEIDLLKVEMKHSRKEIKILDERLQSPLTENQLMIILNEFADINFIDEKEISIVRTIIKCCDTTTPFDPEAFKNNKIKITDSAIKFSVVWDWMITKKFVAVDLSKKFEYANNFFRNKNNLPFKELRKSFKNYETKGESYPDLELKFRAILRKLFPVN